MLLILPVIAFVIFFLILRERGEEWRWALLGAAISCGTCVVAITELLSIPRLISRGPVALFWAVICTAGFFYLRSLKRSSLARVPPAAAERTPRDVGEKWLLAGVAAIVLFVGITAIVAPPHKWDAMDYHLPRMVMWISNHSVRFYPTQDYCQLIYGSWSEYAMMHTQLLWGTDRFVNFVEFFSMLGALIAVSLIAQKLGAGPRGQLLAVVVCATIPQGLLEASGPMNTYVVSFWIATLVAFFYEFSGSPIGVPLPVRYPRLELSMPKMTVRGTAANMLRNASMHLSTPSRGLNSRIEETLRSAIRATGTDPDDPEQSWIGKPYHMNQFTSNESIEGNHCI